MMGDCNAFGYASMNNNKKIRNPEHMRRCKRPRTASRRLGRSSFVALCCCILAYLPLVAFAQHPYENHLSAVVDADADDSIARIGAGIRWRHLYDARSPHRGNNNQNKNNRNRAANYPTRASSLGQQQQQRTYPKRYYSRLSDVWLCLAMALGWTVWMLSSLVRSHLYKYQNSNSVVLVRGHVLQVSRVQGDDASGGLPKYKAVIDYMVESNNSFNSSNKDNDSAQETIQVRKHFETQNLLEQGFANVELLVLQEQPTFSVLREDYEQQMVELQEDEQEALFRHAWCRRLSMTFAAILVLVSLGGCVQVVVRLDPLTRWQGWLSLCVGVALLLPAGLTVHRALQAFQRLMEFQSEKAGIILRGATKSMQTLWDEMDNLDPTACDDDPVESIHPSPRAATPAAVVMAGCTGRAATPAIDPSTSGAGCYFIELPPRQRSQSSNKNSNSSSLSSSNNNSNNNPNLLPEHDLAPPNLFSGRKWSHVSNVSSLSGSAGQGGSGEPPHVGLLPPHATARSRSHNSTNSNHHHNGSNNPFETRTTSSLSSMGNNSH